MGTYTHIHIYTYTHTHTHTSTHTLTESPGRGAVTEAWVLHIVRIDGVRKQNGMHLDGERHICMHTYIHRGPQTEWNAPIWRETYMHTYIHT